MKLNRNGWGSKQLIIMMAFLFIFLVLIMYYIFLLYSDIGNREASVYIELENKLAYAAREYAEDTGNKNKVITLKELKKNEYIEYFLDYNDNACNGYVIHENGEYISYISCDKFTTDNYDENNE